MGARMSRSFVDERNLPGKKITYTPAMLLSLRKNVDPRVGFRFYPDL